MTREQVKEILPLMQAFAEGKTIQVWANGTWQDDEYPFMGVLCYYRIKPEPKSEPKYRPFKTTQEAFKEINEHNHYRWVKSKIRDKMMHIAAIGHNKDGYVEFFCNTGFSGLEHLSSETMFEYFEFIDGSPFGVRCR